MSAVLFSSVTFDQPSGLYTYSYAVENDSTSTVIELAILVGGIYPGGQPIIPSGFTAPDGWILFGAVSGTIADPPYNMHGGFYEWYGNGNVIAPHTSAFGFSVTTQFAPTLDNGLNDFFMIGSEGVIAFGNTLVPSGANWQSPPGVPEPATWLMLLIGFVVLSAAGRRLTVHAAPTS